MAVALLLAMRVVGAISSVMVCGAPAASGLSGGRNPMVLRNSIGFAAISAARDRSTAVTFNGDTISNMITINLKSRASIATYFLVLSIHTIITRQALAAVAP
jgi:hypothetical protein